MGILWQNSIHNQEKKMQESEFNQKIDETLYAIEEAIDDAGVDIDYDTIAGILTLEFNNQSKIIINRQTALSQLWIAAKSGGFHLDFIDDNWFCKADDSYLNDLINRVCSEQAEEAVNLLISI